MALEVELQHVKLRSGGRVHLTARVPDSGPAVTLCSKELKEGSFVAAQGDADCQLCLKRKADPARVSSALFEGGMGEALLELSLRKARERKDSDPVRARTTRVETGRPPRRQQPGRPPAPVPKPPDRLGGLELKGLKQFADRVFQSPAGVVIRVGEEDNDWQLEEVSFSGRVLVRRRPDGGFAIEVGDVRIQYSAQDQRLRAAFLEE